MTIPRLYDHQELEIRLTVNLVDENIEAEILRPKTAAGTHVSGIFDGEAGGRLPSFLPARADRVLRAATFSRGEGSNQTVTRKALPGEFMVTPDPSEWGAPPAAASAAGGTGR